jgi:chorismate lyase/3-hydroxybenzoate synthase
VKLQPIAHRRIAAPEPPPWAREVAGYQADEVGNAADLQISERNGTRLISVTLRDCRESPAEELRRKVREGYQRIFRELQGFHPMRFWNFIPDISRKEGPDLDRYMTFNAARHDAFLELYGSAEALGRNLRTATAIGHDDQDLFLHCLAGETPCQAIENPRQIPAWRYSTAYGPKPPSFSRASIARFGRGQEPQLLIGGTASIRGEASRHLEDLSKQVSETMRNLSELIENAAKDGMAPLARMRSLRVYRSSSIAEGRMEASLRPFLPDHLQIEHHLAALCRPELLVEVEGTARLD